MDYPVGKMDTHVSNFSLIPMCWIKGMFQEHFPANNYIIQHSQLAILQNIAKCCNSHSHQMLHQKPMVESRILDFF